MSHLPDFISKDVANQPFQEKLKQIAFRKNHLDSDFSFNCLIPLVFTNPSPSPKHVIDELVEYQSFFLDACDRIEVLLLEKGIVVKPDFPHDFIKRATSVVSDILTGESMYSKYMNATQPDDGLGDRYVVMEIVFFIHEKHGLLWVISIIEWTVIGGNPISLKRGQPIERYRK